MRQRLSGLSSSAGPSVAAETGAGQLSSVFGLVFFFGLLLTTSQVLLSLHRASAVQAAASDAAHASAQATAGSGGRSCTEAVAEQASIRAEMLLGGHVSTEVSCLGADVLRVTVRAPGVALGAMFGQGAIQRSAEVRVETTGRPA
jgi:hypothetical protein